MLPTNMWLRAFQRRRGATVNARQWVTFQPECASRRCRIDVLALPPCLLIAGTILLLLIVATVVFAPPPDEQEGQGITTTYSTTTTSPQ